jgi:hypothetical protein
VGVEGSESREQLLINWDVAFRLMRLRAKVLSRLNPDDMIDRIRTSLLYELREHRLGMKRLAEQATRLLE